MVALEPTKADLKALDSVMKGEFGHARPNIVLHIYKNRRGKYTRVKLWAYVDLGNMRWYDICVTDNDYNIIPMEKLKIETFINSKNEEGNTACNF